MKIRKILPLVVLAVTAFLLLSGCDAMLDAIFSKDQISVDVAVYTPSHSDYAVGGYVLVQIWNTSGTPSMISQDTKYWDAWSNYYAHYYFNYANLKDGTYTVYAYYYPVVGPTYGAVYSPVQTATMPYPNSGDSTGHSLTIAATIY